MRMQLVIKVQASSVNARRVFEAMVHFVKVQTFVLEMDRRSYTPG